jgi:hypothetical protein
MQRRRIKPEAPLHERLTIFAEGMRAKAANTRPGPERDDLLLRARQAETALRLDGWAYSPGLHPPK